MTQSKIVNSHFFVLAESSDECKMGQTVIRSNSAKKTHSNAAANFVSQRNLIWSLRTRYTEALPHTIKDATFVGRSAVRRKQQQHMVAVLEVQSERRTKTYCGFHCSSTVAFTTRYAALILFWSVLYTGYIALSTRWFRINVIHWLSRGSSVLHVSSARQQVDLP